MLRGNEVIDDGRSKADDGNEEKGSAIDVLCNVAPEDAHPREVGIGERHTGEPKGREDGHAVATRAYVEINDGDSVFLDASRTNLFLADLIAKGDKRCIVTTNMIGVLERLSSNPRITALGTGGYLNMELNGFTGSATVSLLEPLLFAKAFIGCCGIDLKSSAVMSFGMDDGIVRQRAVQNASYKFLLANSMKFGIRGGYRFASITDFSAVITNTTDPAIISQISRMRTPVLS